MNIAYRGFLVWGIGIVAVLLPFLIFVAAGWPGGVNSCVKESPNSCYCEAFDASQIGKPGVRQPVNTWFNLYSILTSLIVALVLYFDRSEGATNLIGSENFIADWYVFAVLFLGLGSMWFHASLIDWAGTFDQLSMFVYAAFLIFFTIRREWDSDLLFWLGYAGTVALFTFIAAIWHWKLASLILILILVAAYLTFEIILWVKRGDFLAWKTLLWSAGVVAIGLATLFWTLSQTGGSMCDPHSVFQPHGLLWHPLAGVMAVFLYFYWRQCEIGAYQSSAAGAGN